MNQNSLYQSYGQWKGRPRPGSRTWRFLAQTPFDIPEAKYLPAQKEARIIDVGCGDGQFLSLLQRRGYVNLTGVDFLDYRQTVPEGIDFIQADVLTYLEQAPPESIDAIYARSIVEHLSRDQAVRFLELCLTRLSKQGCLIAVVPNMASPLGIRYGHGDLTHVLHLTPDSITQLITATGVAFQVEFRPYPNLLRRALDPRTWPYLVPGLLHQMLLHSAMRLYGQSSVSATPDILFSLRRGEKPT